MTRFLTRRQRAFTLIELTVVIVIISILAAVLVPRILDRPEKARRTKAKADIATIQGQLLMFKADTGRFPTTAEGLKALVEDPGVKGWQEKGYLDKVPLDPWNRPYVYLCPGRNGRDYDLLSHGKDGEAGGEGYNADIESWNLDAD